MVSTALSFHETFIQILVLYLPLPELKLIFLFHFLINCYKNFVWSHFSPFSLWEVYSSFVLATLEILELYIFRRNFLSPCVKVRYQGSILILGIEERFFLLGLILYVLAIALKWVQIFLITVIVVKYRLALSITNFGWGWLPIVGFPLNQIFKWVQYNL